MIKWALRFVKEMIEQSDISSFERYKYSSPFTGSYRGMRFRIVHPKKKEDQENLILVDVYPGSYCFEKTKDDLKEHTSYPYTEDGYEQIVSYLNTYYNDHKEMWIENLPEAMKKYTPQEQE